MAKLRVGEYPRKPKNFKLIDWRNKCDAVLLAGGLGTRFAEETDVRPKPMIEIGGKPILWHIMKIYSSHGINDFIICLGYKGYVIKEYFSNYFLHQSNVTFDLRDNRMEVLQKHAEPWRVTLVDTGEETMIGGRIKRILPYIGDDEAFCLTYGDGVARHRHHARASPFIAAKAGLQPSPATQPPGRFGAINHRAAASPDFRRSRAATAAGSMAAFLSCRPRSAITSRATQRSGKRSRWRISQRTASSASYFHDGFWHPMDTLRDKRHLEDLWLNNKAPWKTW